MGFTQLQIKLRIILKKVYLFGLDGIFCSKIINLLLEGKFFNNYDCLPRNIDHGYF